MELLTTTCLDGLARMVGRWGVADDWDVLIAGDGSGAGWDLPIGWGGVLVDRRARRRKRHYGGMSEGTVYVAELMPYAAALRWHAERRRRLGRAAPALVNVHIVTDNAALAQEGNALASGAKPLRAVEGNRADWAGLMAHQWDGYALTFHWIPRATAAINCWCDAMAKICFRAMKELPRPRAPDGREISIYDCNADHDDATALHAIPPASPRPRRRGRRQRGVDGAAGDRDCRPPDGD